MKEFEKFYWNHNDTSLAYSFGKKVWDFQNHQFLEFLDQAVYDSADAQERQTIQRLIEEFKSEIKE